jgi:hypothetical protein
LIKQIGKLHAARLKSSGAGVGLVVGDVIEVDLLGRHSGSRGIQCMKHEVTPLTNLGKVLGCGFIDFRIEHG